MASVALVRVSIGEVLSQNDKHTEINKHEVGHIASQAHKWS
jgi:hypothetical protein